MSDIAKREIVLSICPSWNVEGPPLGILYLSQYIRSFGFDASVLDLNIEIFNDASNSLKNLWNPRKIWCWMDKTFFYQRLFPALKGEISKWAEKISSMDAPLVGFSITRTNLRFTIELVKEIKRIDQSKIVIFGGPACSITGEIQMVPNGLVDAFVVGEGEEILIDIMNNTDQTKTFEKIPGCIVKKGNNFSKLIPREPISELNSIPFPNFNDLDLSRYLSKGLPILGSRGCMNRCSFCNDWIVWPKYRFRSAKNIFEEIMQSVERHNVCDFEFADLALNNNMDEIERLCDLIIKQGLVINWGAHFVIKPAIKASFFKKMNDAGCRALRFGIESGSAKILKLMNKPFGIPLIEKTLVLSSEAGIHNLINIITGFPGEGEDEFNETLEFIKRNKDIIHGFGNVSPCYLTPNSMLEKCHEDYGIVLPNENFSLEWYDSTGNTYELRKDRTQRLRQFIKKLGIGLDEEKTLFYFDEELKKSRLNHPIQDEIS